MADERNGDMGKVRSSSGAGRESATTQANRHASRACRFCRMPMHQTSRIDALKSPGIGEVRVRHGGARRWLGGVGGGGAHRPREEGLQRIWTDASEEPTA